MVGAEKSLRRASCGSTGAKVSYNLSGALINGGIEGGAGDRVETNGRNSLGSSSGDFGLADDPGAVSALGVRSINGGERLESGVDTDGAWLHEVVVDSAVVAIAFVDEAPAGSMVLGAASTALVNADSNLVASDERALIPLPGSEDNSALSVSIATLELFEFLLDDISGEVEGLKSGKS